MKKLLLLALMGMVILSATPVLAEDGFYVIPTRATPGTAITHLPYPINASGYYYLTRNLTSTGSNGITVNADNVTIDLMGFTLSGPETNNSNGIYITQNNVEVRNGTVSGWLIGVAQTSNRTGARAIGVRAVGNTYGIALANDGLIKGCTASPGSDTTGTALYVMSGTISGCTVMDFSPSNASQISISSGGRISDNMVLLCKGAGIMGGTTLGSTTITGNAVINCETGIDMSWGGSGSLVGNTVRAISGQTALKFNNTPVVADQNSFYLDGATFYTGTFLGVWGLTAYTH